MDLRGTAYAHECDAAVAGERRGLARTAVHLGLHLCARLEESRNVLARSVVHQVSRGARPEESAPRREDVELCRATRCAGRQRCTRVGRAYAYER